MILKKKGVLAPEKKERKKERRKKQKKEKTKEKGVKVVGSLHFIAAFMWDNACVRLTSLT